MVHRGLFAGSMAATVSPAEIALPLTDIHAMRVSESWRCRLLGFTIVVSMIPMGRLRPRQGLDALLQVPGTDHIGHP
jgi:hypothetical protein